MDNPSCSASPSHSSLPYILELSGGSLLVKVDLTASLLGIPYQTLRNLISKGAFPVRTVKVGMARRVPATALAAFIDGQVEKDVSLCHDSPELPVHEVRRPGRPRLKAKEFGDGRGE